VFGGVVCDIKKGWDKGLKRFLRIYEDFYPYFDGLEILVWELLVCG
jgi:hypothetical protein